MFVIGSLCTVLLVWPVYAILTVALFAAAPALGCAFLILCAVPILSRVIAALQLRYSVTAEWLKPAP
jgi:hypothetical protein